MLALAMWLVSSIGASIGRKMKGAKMTLEEAKKLLDEEYERAKQLDYVINPLAYALYQVWKKADAQRSRNGTRKP